MPEKDTQMAKGYTVLIVDVGGRGAALVHKYSQSKFVKRILAVPGHDLLQINSKKPVKIYPHLETTSTKEILEICKKEKVDLVDVAQDNAVEAGVADALAGVVPWISGPSRNAGRIEWDKAWARDFMAKYKIPHPEYKVFTSQKAGITYIKKQKEGKWFIKANGLLAGKGALPAHNKKEAIARIREMSKFGEQGNTFLIEEWLEGEEFSYFVASDGKTYKTLGAAQDHKRMFNFDEGENTGGMGCSAPPLVVTKKLVDQVERQIIKKTLSGLAKEGRAFKGILYLGGIVVRQKPYVIEFNARLGSPEAEVLVPAVQSDYFQLGRAISEGNLRNYQLKLDKKSRVAVTLALRSNPSGVAGKDGCRIYGVDEAKKISSVTLYGARVSKKGNKYYAGSGRLLHIVGEGKNVIEAREKAYRAAAHFWVEGNNLHYRTDIGWRDVERLRKG